MSDDAVMKEILATLQDIRDNQRRQLERQEESMKIQREQFALATEQFEKAKKLQDRAESIQAKSADIVEKGRKAVAVILPVLILLVGYLTWIMFRRY